MAEKKSDKRVYVADSELTQKGRPRKRKYTVSEKVYERNNKYGKRSPKGIVPAQFDRDRYIQPGDNDKYLSCALAVANLPPIDIEDGDAVMDRMIEYFEIARDRDVRPSVAGIASALGISRRTFVKWTNGESRVGTKQAQAAMKAHMILNQLWEDYMMNGKMHPASGIFIGKNNFGYVDTLKIEADNIKENVRDGRTDDELLELYDAPIETDAEVID